jgi:hypothetical protein
MCRQHNGYAAEVDYGKERELGAPALQKKKIIESTNH